MNNIYRRLFLRIPLKDDPIHEKEILEEGRQEEIWRFLMLIKSETNVPKNLKSIVSVREL